MKLEIGPGTAPLFDADEGYETVDKFQHHNPTYCFDIAKTQNWPITKKYDEVIAIHVLEHMELKDLDNIFNNVYKILNNNGMFKVHVPNGPVIAKAYLKYPEHRFKVQIGGTINLCLYGAESEEEGKQAFGHKILYDYDLLKFKFYDHGFTFVSNVSTEYTDRHDTYWNWMCDKDETFSLKVYGIK